MKNKDRIRRLELALAALCEMLENTNPHIAEQLADMAETLGES